MSALEEGSSCPPTLPCGDQMPGTGLDPATGDGTDTGWHPRRVLVYVTAAAKLWIKRGRVTATTRFLWLLWPEITEFAGSWVVEVKMSLHIHSFLMLMLCWRYTTVDAWLLPLLPSVYSPIQGQVVGEGLWACSNISPHALCERQGNSPDSFPVPIHTQI